MHDHGSKSPSAHTVVLDFIAMLLGIALVACGRHPPASPGHDSPGNAVEDTKGAGVDHQRLDELTRRRVQQIARLIEYRDAGRFPRNHWINGQTPVFIDDRGVPCAVAYLMVRDGQDALAAQVAADDNHMFVDDITSGPVLDWILRSGLLQEEAVYIQPGYWNGMRAGIEHQRLFDHFDEVIRVLQNNTEQSVAEAAARLSQAEPAADTRSAAEPVEAARFVGRSPVTGEYHSCAIDTDERVWCWGGNDHGQLGDGTLRPRATPARVPLVHDVVALTAGPHHTCAGQRDGRVWCWGAGAGFGRRRPNRDYYGMPEIVGTVDGGDALRLWASSGRTCASAGEGPEICWGEGGRAHTDSNASNRGHACTSRPDGTIWCAGRNDQGQLGDGQGGPRHRPVVIDNMANIAHIAAGDYFTCTLAVEGGADCWGQASGSASFPDDGIAMIRAGGAYMCGVSYSGEVFCWRPNDESYPFRIYDLNGVTQLAMGGDYACAVRHHGEVVCWQPSAHGQRLRRVPGIRRPVALAIGQIQPHKEEDEFINYNRTQACALGKDGRVLCWNTVVEGPLNPRWAFSQPVVPPGKNGGSSVPEAAERDAEWRSIIPESKAPTEPAKRAADSVRRPRHLWAEPDLGPPESIKDAADIAIAEGLCIASVTGEVSCLNSYDGGVERISIAGMTGIKQLAAGGRGLCGVTTNGRVLCGAGPDYESMTGQAVDLGIEQAQEIAVGAKHVCAVIAGGRVACAGDNAFNQLGIGSNTSLADVPVVGYHRPTTPSKTNE